MTTLSTKNVYSIGIISLVLGLAFTYLFFDKVPGISLVIYVALILSGLFGLLTYFKIQSRKIIAYYLLPLLFFPFMVSVQDNEFLTFFNFVMTLGLLMLLSSHLVGQSVKNFLILDYAKTAVLLPLKIIGKAFNALVRMLSVGKGIKDNQQTSQVTKGVLLTIPIVLFFLALFSSADLAFNHFLSGLFNFNFNLNENTIPKIWWTGIFTFVWLGAGTYILENGKEGKIVEVEEKVPTYRFGNIEAGILFTTLNVLFLTFVIVQIKYLFAGHSAITSLGFTYADYAHKGFGELVTVALFTFGLIFLADVYIERKENQSGVLFKSLTGLLIILVLVIMASAFTRLNIYEQAYSFTRQRILVQGFILWLAVVFLWLSYKIMFGTKTRQFIFGIFLSIITFFVVFNLFNPDAFIAKKNIAKDLNTGRLDTKYLSILSADAIPELAPLLNMPMAKDINGNPLPHEVAVILKNYHDLNLTQSWQSYNFSRARAKNIINNNWDLISKLAQ
ncbi:MAG: DUF4173 domain-containing protein [Candidatus Doudnabacteria bacterium]|jgi:hypothetical protein